MTSSLIHKAGLVAGTLAISLLLATGAQAANRATTPAHATPAHGMSSRGAPAGAMDKVNLNTADAATIDRVLLNVGPSKAQAIVEYRKEHGSFKSLEQLALVKGIGLKTVEKNRDRIVLGGGAAAPRPAARPVAQR